MGLPWQSYLIFYISPEEVINFRIVGLLCQLISSILFYFILKDIKFIGDKKSILITLLYTVLPVNSVQNVGSIQHYYIYTVLFLVGYYLLIYYYNSYVAMIIACIFFFLSFSMASLIVLMIVPISHFAFNRLVNQDLVHQDNKKTWLAKFWIVLLLILPILFFTLKTLFFKPYGLYFGYNSINIKSLTFASLILIFSILIFISFYQSCKSQYHSIMANSLLLSLSGLVVLNLSVFPYIAVGNYFPYENFGHRHEILWPFGISIILVGILYVIKTYSTLIFRVVFLALITYSFFWHFVLGFHYLSDYKKSLQIIEAIQEDRQIFLNSLVVYDDLNTKCNIYSRGYNFVEITGIFRKALNHDGQLVVSSSALSLYKNGSIDHVIGSKSVLDYNATNFQKSDQFIYLKFDFCSNPRNPLWEYSIKDIANL